MNDYITIIGGGLAGNEAAYQIAKRGIKVKLYEMKPNKFSPAHSNIDLAEIVCSNSFKSNNVTNACGLLKEELRRLDSLLIKVADSTAVPAGQALAVDREKFSKKVTEELANNRNIDIIREEFIDLTKENGIIIIATGPLTSDKLTNEIIKITGENSLSFFDAAAPIIEKNSINFDIAFYGDRYSQEKKKEESIEEWKKRLKNEEQSYINLPMNKEEYKAFYEELINAEVVTLHEFEKKEIFEGCMPIEVMAKRGIDTIRFGPLKPVGFDDLRTAKRPYAIVQLRQDNNKGTLYNMVGFQTNLKFGEQKRVFSMIPGLENAEFIKYGVMHRNTYINSPKLLDETYNLKSNHRIYFAGQITGVEGYVESIASGLVAGINASLNFQMKNVEERATYPNFEEIIISNQNKCIFPKQTVIGALASYISSPNENFQPMNANFGILPELETKIKDKHERYKKLAEISLKESNIAYVEKGKREFVRKEKTEDTIKDLFLAKLKALDNSNSEKLLDYRVDEVKIINSKDQSFIDLWHNSNDILAYVTYSVKPKNVNSSNWIAGNGEIEGEWIINKVACECLRNGKLVNSTGLNTGW